jgi:zinc/manganese transport system permease protein
MEGYTLFLYPFLGCLVLILIHAYFGIHVLERGIIFVDLSLAQFISLGSAAAVFLGVDGPGRYLCAAAFAVAGALILSLSGRISRFVNIEAFIGVLYFFSLGAAILVLDRTPHGLEELKEILNGNILWISGREVLNASLLYAAVGLFHFAFRKRFFALSYGGKASVFWDFLFFLTFALVLVSSVHLAGVLQVFAFLVVPSLIGRLFSREPVRVLFSGWLIGLGVSIAGIVLSYAFDLPTAPVMVCLVSLAFFVLLASKAAVAGRAADAGREEGRGEKGQGRA